MPSSAVVSQQKSLVRDKFIPPAERTTVTANLCLFCRNRLFLQLDLAYRMYRICIRIVYIYVHWSPRVYAVIDPHFGALNFHSGVPLESHNREHVCWLHVCPRQQSKGKHSTSQYTQRMLVYKHLHNHPHKLYFETIKTESRLTLLSL